MDALKPRVHGGGYNEENIEDNIAFVRSACNVAKGHGSILALRAIKNHALPGSGCFLGVQPTLSETLAPHDA
jgi:hypothetical protein